MKWHRTEIEDHSDLPSFNPPQREIIKNYWKAVLGPASIKALREVEREFQGSPQIIERIIRHDQLLADLIDPKP